MSCRSIRRELLWLTRFGQLGPDSQSHLDHLVGCRTCRDEVGYDRELVRQLRAALAARVEGIEPSSAVWEQVRVAAQQPERRRFPWPFRRPADALGLRRSLTAMAGTGLALVLALNTQVVPVLTERVESTPGPSTEAAGGAVTSWDRLPRIGSPSTEPAPSTRLELDTTPDPAGLIANVDATQVANASTGPVEEEQPTDAEPAGEILVVLRAPLGHEAPAAEADDTSQQASHDEPANPVPSPAGAPT